MKSMMEFIKKYWLIMIITIQPILDIISYFQTKIGGQSYTWIARIILLIIIIAISFLKSKNKKSLFLKLSPIILFFILHFANLYRINNLNLISDLKYFVYVFQLPVLAIFLIDYYKNNLENLKDVKKGIIISGVIIIVSIAISFITNTYEPTYITSSHAIGITGWFSSANTNSMILCAIIPFIMYYFLYKKNPFIYGIISALCFAPLYLNGTKSCYLTLLATLIILIYITIVDKKITNKKSKTLMTVFLLIISLCLYNTSFTKTRNILETDNNESYKNEISEKPNNPGQIKPSTKPNEKEKNELIEILNTSYLYRDLINLHGEDKVIEALRGEFKIEDLSNNRLVKIINARISYNESDTLTRILGFGYSKISNQGYDMENDLHAIFYYYGFLGFIIYTIYLLYFLTKMIGCFIKDFKVILDGEFIMLGFIFTLLIFGGEYSGAFLRKSNANIYLSLYLVFIYYKCSSLTEKQHNIKSNKILKLFDKTYSKSKQEYINKMKKNLIDNKKTFVVTANPEAFMLGEKNDSYLKMLLDKNTEIIPDGIGLVKAGRMLGYNIEERIPGIDLAENLLEMASKYNKKIYLFGSKKEVIDKMAKLIKVKYPNATLVGAKDGYIQDKDKVFEDMIKKEADVILVALGMPMQEELIYKHLNKFKKGIFVGVGGSFDVLSGSKKRAPKIFIKLNIEWLYRILKEPKRIKRFYDNNVKFLFKIYKIKK